MTITTGTQPVWFKRFMEDFVENVINAADGNAWTMAQRRLAYHYIEQLVQSPQASVTVPEGIEAAVARKVQEMFARSCVLESALAYTFAGQEQSWYADAHKRAGVFCKRLRRRQRRNQERLIAPQREVIQSLA